MHFGPAGGLGAVTSGCAGDTGWQRRSRPQLPHEGGELSRPGGGGGVVPSAMLRKEV